MTCHQLLPPLLDEIRSFRRTARELWLTHGWDATLNLFQEGLNFDGIPADLPKRRFRVQSRQIYVYAQAYAETAQPRYLEHAEAAWETSCKLYRKNHGGFITSVDLTGKPLEKNCQCYEQAFGIFAAVWLYHITGTETYREDTEKIWSFLDTHMRHPKGGFCTDYPTDPKQQRQQNPHMHLAEAALFAFMFTGDPVWADRAAEMIGLFQTYFYDPRYHVVTEIFHHDWTLPHTTMSEPGHAAEWSWLIRIYGLLTGDEYPGIQTALYQKMMHCGVDPKTMIGIDGVTPEGAPLKTSRRLWVQCEMIKAHLSILESGGGDAALESVITLLQTLISTYLLPNGVWHEHLNATGQDMVLYAPATSLYHLNMAFHEVFRVLEPLQYSQKCAGCQSGCRKVEI